MLISQVSRLGRTIILASQIVALLVSRPSASLIAIPDAPAVLIVKAPREGPGDLAFPAPEAASNFGVKSSSPACALPANPIVMENCLPGTNEWQIRNFNATYWQVNQHDIEGFASATSVDAGSDITFYINTDAQRYNLLIFRSGYYGGTGGRLLMAIRDLPGRTQPACHDDNATGLVSCSNWIVSYRLTIPENWVSGVYLAKLIRTDTQSENYMLFVVRNDAHHTAILYQLSVATYQAYNYYLGKSLYSVVSYNQCLTVAAAPRAVKVSFDRPYAFPAISFYNNYFWADYQMVFWLESQGYDVGYSTDMDTHLAGQRGQHNTLQDHRVFLVVGHDEYWTQEMRDAVTAARDAGVHLGFFSSNVSFWRIRFEADPWTGQPDRVMVSYKTTESGPPDPTGIPTGLWRDPSGSNDPENALIGTQYIGDNDTQFFPFRVTAQMASDRIYRNTGLQDMPAGTYAEIGTGLVGWEWDGVANNGHSPQGLKVLAESLVYGPVLIGPGLRYELGNAVAQTTRYIAASGAIVFASGTNFWSWGLALNDVDRRLQQITYNLFSDMGVQPITPAENLVLDGVTAPKADAYEADGVHPLDTGHGPMITNIQAVATDSTVTIYWETDVPADGQAWVKNGPGQINWGIYGEATSVNQPIAGVALVQHLGLSHSVTIGELQPGTAYYLQIATSNAALHTTISDETAFQTKAGSLLAQAKSFLRPGYRAGVCWYQSNPTPGPIIVAGLMIIGGLWCGWKLRTAVRRRKTYPIASKMSLNGYGPMDPSLFGSFYLAQSSLLTNQIFTWNL